MSDLDQLLAERQQTEREKFPLITIDTHAGSSPGIVEVDGAWYGPFVKFGSASGW